MTRRVFWIVAVLMLAAGAEVRIKNVATFPPLQAKSVVPKEPHRCGAPVGVRLVLGASPTIDSSAG